VSAGQEPRAPRFMSREMRAQEAGEAAAKPLSLGLIRRMFSFTRPYAAKRNWLLLTVIVRAVQIPVIALLIGAIINGPIAAGDIPGTLWAVAAFAAFVFVTEVVFYWRMRLAMELGEAVVHDLRNHLYAQLLRQPMSYYHKTRLGSIISRMVSDIEAMRIGVQNVLFVTLVQLGAMLGAGIGMAWFNWRLFCILFAMAPIIYFINSYFRVRISTASRQLQRSFSRVTASLAETVNGIRVTQGFSREEMNAGLFDELVRDHGRYNMNVARNTSYFFPLLQLNSQFFIAIMLLVGGHWALTGKYGTQVGDLIYYFFFVNLFFQPITVIARMYAQALAAMAGAERVFNLLDREPEWEDAPHARDPGPIGGRVAFEHVTFGYKPGEPVLHDLSFAVNPGETVALVGHTGSGKSSIINLLCKFYRPQQGRILIDHTPLEDISSDALHRRLGLVLQHNFLFSGNVLDNMRLGRPEATEEEVVEALRRLDLLDLAEAMPEGLHTPVAEKGRGLSLGQQQLVCFTRAFLVDPAILILDEATSSVDSITEARLQRALNTLLEGRTSFIVAHRLSTIRNAGQILVLEHGRLIERGNHESLLRHNGVYAGLYRQFVASGP